MRLLADEGVDARIVARLRDDGWDVGYVAEMAPGISDDEVLEIARWDSRLLITVDTDFGELVFRQHRLTHGVVLLRISGLGRDEKAESVSAVLREYGQAMAGAFSVIGPGLVRIRPSI